MNEQAPINWDRWISVGVAVLFAILSSLGIRVAWPPSAPALPPTIEQRIAATETAVKDLSVKQEQVLRAATQHGQ